MKEAKLAKLATAALLCCVCAALGLPVRQVLAGLLQVVGAQIRHDHLRRGKIVADERRESPSAGGDLQDSCALTHLAAGAQVATQRDERLALHRILPPKEERLCGGLVLSET